MCNCFVFVFGNVESASFDLPAMRFGTSGCSYERTEILLTVVRVTLAQICFGIRRRIARFYLRIGFSFGYDALVGCKTRNGKRFVRKNARPVVTGFRRRRTDVKMASGKRADLSTGRPAAANARGISPFSPPKGFLRFSARASHKGANGNSHNRPWRRRRTETSNTIVFIRTRGKRRRLLPGRSPFRTCLCDDHMAVPRNGFSGRARTSTDKRLFGSAERTRRLPTSARPRVENTNFRIWFLPRVLRHHAIVYP